MKAKNILTTVLFLLGIATFAKAQTTTGELVKEWERAKTYTKAYLDAMPESGYSLKPTPEMRSFADQMQHLADANYGFVGNITGEKSPIEGSLEKTGDKSKTAVTKQVLDSYDFVIASLKKLSPAQLNEQIKLFGKFDITRSMAFAKAFEHQTHHRGQTTVYLRLAKVTPPEEMLF